jgi:hypothetical protein
MLESRKVVTNAWGMGSASTPETAFAASIRIACTCKGGVPYAASTNTVRACFVVGLL